MDRTINRRAVFSAFLAGSCLSAPGANGDTDLAGVPVHMLRHQDGPRRYLVIHGDEDTAKRVLTDHMKSHAGVGYVVTGMTRNVEMRGLTIDPNRMWSRVGAKLSLLNPKLNKNPDVAQVERVLDELDLHRPAALQRLIPGTGSRLFALHNNRDYSINNELGASDRTSVPQRDMPRHFFLCTDPGDFEILKTSRYNVVLQTQAEPDDGSLSRLAARRGFRYVNLECAIGDYAGQRERVDWLEQKLGV